MDVRIKKFDNAVALVLVCKHQGMVRTLTFEQARAILDANPGAVGTDAYDALAFAGL